MTEQAPAEEPRSESDKGKVVASGSAAAAKVPPAGETDIPLMGEPVPVNQLSPEEQMARFEKELKEKDWGHQPC